MRLSLYLLVPGRCLHINFIKTASFLAQPMFQRKKGNEDVHVNFILKMLVRRGLDCIGARA